MCSITASLNQSHKYSFHTSIRGHRCQRVGYIWLGRMGSPPAQVKGFLSLQLDETEAAEQMIRTDRERLTSSVRKSLNLICPVIHTRTPPAQPRPPHLRERQRACNSDSTITLQAEPSESGQRRGSWAGWTQQMWHFRVLKRLCGCHRPLPCVNTRLDYHNIWSFRWPRASGGFPAPLKSKSTLLTFLIHIPGPIYSSMINRCTLFLRKNLVFIIFHKSVTRY